MADQARHWGLQALAALLLALLTELSRRLGVDAQQGALIWPAAGLGAVYLARWGWQGLLPLAAGLLTWALLAFDLPPAQRLSLVASGLAGPLLFKLLLGRHWRLRRGGDNPFDDTASLGRVVAVQSLLAAPLVGLVALLLAWPAEADALHIIERIGQRWVAELAGFLLLAPLAWELLLPRLWPMAGVVALLRQGRRHALVVLLLIALVAVASSLWWWPSAGVLAQGVTYLLAPLLALSLAGVPRLAAYTTLAIAGFALSAAQAHAPPSLQPPPAMLVTLFVGVAACAVLAVRGLLNAQRQARRQLEQQAFIDLPTGLLNRAGLNRLLGDWSGQQGGRDRALLSLRAGNLDAIEALGGPQRLAELDLEIATELRRELPHVRWSRLAPLRFVGAVPQLLDARADLGTLERIAVGVNTRLREALHAPLWGVAGLRIANNLSLNTGTLISALREIEHRALASRRSEWGAADAETQHALARSAAQGQALRARLEARDVVVVAQALQANHAGVAADGLRIEVLCRLAGPDGELQTPAEFLPVAIRHGLMPLLDLVVVEQTLAWFAAQPAAFERLASCGLNLSGPSLADPGTPERLALLFQRYALDPTRFVIEVTENQAIAQLAQGMENLRALRALGCRIALDDFGTGLATFDYLKRFPVDSIKIDGSFVRNLEHSAVDRAIVESIVRVARAMGVRTVAEFVETPRLARLVTEIGVDESQGYAIGLPQRLEQLFAEVLDGQGVPSTLPGSALENWALAGA